MKESDFFTPHNVMWTFAGCLAIYFVAYGAVSAAPKLLDAIYGILFASEGLFEGLFSLFPAGVRILIGVFLYQRSQKELLH